MYEIEDTFFCFNSSLAFTLQIGFARDHSD
jgi:hypothetical protein